MIAILLILILLLKAKYGQLNTNQIYLYSGVLIAFFFGLIIPTAKIMKRLYNKLKLLCKK